MHGHDHVPAPDEPSIPELEEDEDVPPRPEEEIADEMREEQDDRDDFTDQPAGSGG